MYCENGVNTVKGLNIQTPDNFANNTLKILTNNACVTANSVEPDL